VGKIDLRTIVKRHRLNKKPNVVGYSGVLQRKIKDGKERREWAIRLYVERKVALDSLTEEDRIPAEVEGVKTDVIEVGEMKALADEDPKKHYRPCPAGVSAIADTGTACTLGWFARDKTDGKIVVICNNHCGALENKAPTGHPYMQTSPYDSQHGEVKKLGTLKRFVEIKYTNFKCTYRNTLHAILYRTPRRILGLGESTNAVDLAIIEVEDCDIKRELLNVGSVMGKRRGVEGESMMKMGRTTGKTTNGLLRDNDYYGSVQYGRGTAMFGPCMLIEGDMFSQGGDSSSAILCQSDKSFAGLLFAGSNTHTIGCHFDLIESLGGVEIMW
jgi:hypothetical protein